jgi:hypothetical protein
MEESRSVELSRQDFTNGTLPEDAVFWVVANGAQEFGTIQSAPKPGDPSTTVVVFETTEYRDRFVECLKDEHGYSPGGSSGSGTQGGHDGGPHTAVPTPLAADSYELGRRTVSTSDESFNVAYMEAISTPHWFDGMHPSESRKEDLTFCSEKGLDVSETFSRIADRVDEFILRCRSIVRSGDRYFDIIQDPKNRRDIAGIGAENAMFVLETLGKYKLGVPTGGSKGYQNCPWEGDFSWADEYVVRNTETGAVMAINTGISHMLRDHHAFEKGKGNPYAGSVESFLREFMD